MIDAVKKESNSQRKARRKREKEAEEAAQAQAQAKAKEEEQEEDEEEKKATEEKEKEAIETQKRLMLEFEAAKKGNGGRGRGGRGGRGGRSSERGSGCESSQTPSSSSDDKLCVICMDADSTHVNVPCGHACLCQDCAELLDSKKTRECPTCRGPVSMRMRVFF